ncbi:hypothetical protein EDD85DRAFT_970049 [Armillaria nabsnona]|nr:hypothetical protein EDD85DRAFT_970049 [Armillaria nabsnona]
MDIIKVFLFEKTALVATLAKQLYGNIISTSKLMHASAWIFFGGQARGSKRSIRLEVTNVHSSSDSYSSILNEHTDGPQEPAFQIHSVAKDRNDGVLRMHTVLSVPVADLAGTTISLDLLAMPRNFCLVNCAALIDFNELQIIKFLDISFDAPMTSYNSPPSFAAISYPWCDLQLPPGTNTPSFSVNGTTHADNISIDVLHTTCIATRSLVRLAGLAEPTLCTDQAWMLQEASAPGKEKVKCLFKFTHASFKTFSMRNDLKGTKLLHIPLDFGARRSLSALWALAYTRSTSRPVDMVFTVMDLLGINLNVKQFLPEERTKATIKLIQEVMKLQGGRANGCISHLGSSNHGRSLHFQRCLRRARCAYFSTSTGKVLAINVICAEERWRAGGLPNLTPKGEKTDSGCFVFTAKAALVSIIQAQDSKIPGKMAARLASMMKAYDNREMWAIVIGRLRNWNRNPKTWTVAPMSYGAPKPEGVLN